MFWFITLPFLAGAALFAKKTHTSENGRNEDVYLIGKKGNPKAVFVTNQAKAFPPLCLTHLLMTVKPVLYVTVTHGSGLLSLWSTTERQL